MLDQKSVHCTYSTLLRRVKSVEINSSKEILLVVVFWPDDSTYPRQLVSDSFRFGDIYRISELCKLVNVRA